VRLLIMWRTSSSMTKFQICPFVLCSHLTAQFAADWPHDLCVQELSRLDPKRAQLGVRKFTRLFGCYTNSGPALRRRHRASAPKRKRLHPDRSNGDGRRRVIRVQRAENKMAGETRVGGDACVSSREFRRA
jgi:hypothetical protein